MPPCKRCRIELAQQRRAWNEAHPEHSIPHNKSRSLKRRGHRLVGTAREYLTVLLGDRCSYCGGRVEEIDHIEPIQLGGSSAWDNLTAACQSCNRSKRDLPLLAFLAR